jgi:hypothetical protein
MNTINLENSSILKDKIYNKPTTIIMNGSCIIDNCIFSNEIYIIINGTKNKIINNRFLEINNKKELLLLNRCCENNIIFNNEFYKGTNILIHDKGHHNIFYKNRFDYWRNRDNNICFFSRDSYIIHNEFIQLDGYIKLIFGCYFALNLIRDCKEFIIKQLNIVIKNEIRTTKINIEDNENVQNTFEHNYPDKNIKKELIFCHKKELKLNEISKKNLLKVVLDYKVEYKEIKENKINKNCFCHKTKEMLEINNLLIEYRQVNNKMKQLLDKFNRILQ